MPKLWSSTIESHRESVRAAVLDAAATLVAGQGVSGLTMAAVAQTAGIGRATLYKYFPDVEAILLAWHERHVSAHVARLVELGLGDAPPWQRLEAVAVGYALIAHERSRHGADLGALVHRGPEVAKAEVQVSDVFARVLAEVADTGELRSDVPVSELAQYCVHALTAGGSLGSRTAVHRLVMVTLAGLRAPR